MNLGLKVQNKTITIKTTFLKNSKEIRETIRRVLEELI